VPERRLSTRPAASTARTPKLPTRATPSCDAWRARTASARRRAARPATAGALHKASEPTLLQLKQCLDRTCLLPSQTPATPQSPPAERPPLVRPVRRRHVLMESVRGREHPPEPVASSAGYRGAFRLVRGRASGARTVDEEFDRMGRLISLCRAHTVRARRQPLRAPVTSRLAEHPR
jgi:hypothetical protein